MTWILKHLHYTHNHGRRKGWDRRGQWPLLALGNLTFSYWMFSKLDLVSIRKNEISRFSPPLRKFLVWHGKIYFTMPVYTFVWLIVGNWWTILLWSGSTKGWRAGSAILLIFTEAFLWLTHQKLDYPEIFWYNFRNWGGNCPQCPTLATRLIA